MERMMGELDGIIKELTLWYEEVESSTETARLIVYMRKIAQRLDRLERRLETEMRSQATLNQAAVERLRGIPQQTEDRHVRNCIAGCPECNAIAQRGQG